jgi:hypothetical protein
MQHCSACGWPINFLHRDGYCGPDPRSAVLVNPATSRAQFVDVCGNNCLDTLTRYRGWTDPSRDQLRQFFDTTRHRGPQTHAEPRTGLTA